MDTFYFNTLNDDEYTFVVSTLGENPNFRKEVWVALDLVRAKRLVDVEKQPCMLSLFPKPTNRNLYNSKLYVHDSTSRYVEFRVVLDPTYQADKETSEFLIRVVAPKTA